MALRIAINGFGRIGRCAARIILDRDDCELVAINDTAKREITRHLLKYDSVHGEFKKDVEIVGEDIKVDGKLIKMSSTREPREIDFNGADVVLECTGAFLTKEKCQPYIDQGIKLVVMSAPAKDDTPTFVMGVNESSYNGDKIISNASCTTNGLAPIAKVLDDKFGIVKGLMTTVHAYTASQPLLDTKGGDFRKSRAAATNIIPTTTGAAKAIGLVLPNLQGKLNGLALRVPVPNVSMVDLTAVLAKDTTIDEVNDAFKEYAFKNPEILLVDEDGRVSTDFISSSYSSVYVKDMTQLIDKNLIKVLAWYDNEWGYSTRLVDLALYAGAKI